MSQFIFCVKAERGTYYGVLEAEDKYKARHLVCVWVAVHEVGSVERCSISGVSGGDIQVETLVTPSRKLFECPECQSVGFEPSKLPGRCTFCDGTEGGNPPAEEAYDATREDAFR